MMKFTSRFIGLMRRWEGYVAGMAISSEIDAGLTESLYLTDITAVALLLTVS